MDTTSNITTPTKAADARLRPLRLALFVSGIAPWLAVEKVFMTELGFTPALVAAMAAAYAAVVPVLEVPAGVLADRWSRRGVLMLAQGAALVSAAIAALSHGVGGYIASAMVLGIYFALQSGTVDAIVYDTLLEETGTADGYETAYGRIQSWNSFALTASALAGGLIAALTSARATYLLTLPFALAGVLLLMRLREPTLHRQSDRPSLRTHLLATGQAMRRPRVALVVAGTVACAAAMQATFEFGPLWLLAAGTATVVLGPYTAGLTATLGLGARLAPRLRLDHPGSAAAVSALLAASSLTLVVPLPSWLVIAGQTLLVALLVAAGIHLSRLLHDAVPSAMRTAVASGASTLSWLAFLPSSLLFGLLSMNGVHPAGWVVVGLAVSGGAVVLGLSRRAVTWSSPSQSPRPEPACVL